MPFCDYHTPLSQAVAKHTTASAQELSSQPPVTFIEAKSVSLNQPSPATPSIPPSRSLLHWHNRWFRRPTRIYLALMTIFLASCNRPAESPINLKLHQQWQLQPGQTIASYPISSGLGDVVINLGGKAIYMPKAGRIQPLANHQNEAFATETSATNTTPCVAVSSPEIPAYRLRLCNLRQLRLGTLPAGEVIGRGDQVAIAMLRKQPEGTWAFVEPSPSLLEALLTQS